MRSGRVITVGSVHHTPRDTGGDHRVRIAEAVAVRVRKSEGAALIDLRVAVVVDAITHVFLGTGIDGRVGVVAIRAVGHHVADVSIAGGDDDPGERVSKAVAVEVFIDRVL